MRKALAAHGHYDTVRLPRRLVHGRDARRGSTFERGSADVSAYAADAAASLGRSATWRYGEKPASAGRAGIHAIAGAGRASGRASVAAPTSFRARNSSHRTCSTSTRPRASSSSSTSRRRSSSSTRTRAARRPERRHRRGVRARARCRQPVRIRRHRRPQPRRSMSPAAERDRLHVHRSRHRAARSTSAASAGAGEEGEHARGRRRLLAACAQRTLDVLGIELRSILGAMLVQQRDLVVEAASAVERRLAARTDFSVSSRSGSRRPRSGRRCASRGGSART